MLLIADSRYSPPESVKVQNSVKPRNERSKQNPVQVNSVKKVRLLSGEIVNLKQTRVIGYCHNRLHPGKLNHRILQEHDCLGKSCPFLEKYNDRPFWKEQKRIAEKKAVVKAQKKQSRAEAAAKNQQLEDIRTNLRQIAERLDSSIEIVRVEMPQVFKLKVFYVSDYPFADGNRFPEFLEAAKAAYPGHGIYIRHIKDVDGHFVTRKEYFARGK